jgi:putative endonuclease
MARPHCDAPTPTPKAKRGRRAQRSGVIAETAVCLILQREGWTIHGRRLLTEAGEVDIVAEREGLLAIIEVKQRKTLSEAAASISPRQRARLIRAAEILLAVNAHWGLTGVRFDVMLVDASGMVRRVADAFRLE